MTVQLNGAPAITPTDPTTVDVTVPVSPFNFGADWRPIDEGPGKIIYTNVVSPVDRPCTLRLAQTVRPNIYAGTAIETGAMLPNKRGVDTVVEIKDVWSLTSSEDPTFLQYAPVRAALTTNLPVHALVDATAVLNGLILPLIAGLMSGDAVDGARLTEGLTDLLHGVVEKR